MSFLIFSFRLQWRCNAFDQFHSFSQKKFVVGFSKIKLKLLEIGTSDIISDYVNIYYNFIDFCHLKIIYLPFFSTSGFRSSQFIGINVFPAYLSKLCLNYNLLKSCLSANQK